MRCADRMEIRQLVHMARQLPRPPLLEKVKAHDVAAIAVGHPKAVGNDLADQLAQCAAKGLGHTVWHADTGLFGDAVELVDASGEVVLDVLAAVHCDHWAHCLQQLVRRRPWFGEFYPSANLID